MSRYRFKRFFRGLAPLALALAVPSAAMAAGEQSPQSLLDPAGPQARELYGALTFDVIVTAGLWVLLTLLTLYIIIRFKRRATDQGMPTQVEGNPRLEAGWTVALILGLVVLLWHPVNAEFVFEKMPEKPEALEVEVIGHQWWWEFRYPDEKIVTANELHIPVGKKVLLKMTSADVIHAFGVARLGGKNDALPGRVTKMWIQADEAGVYNGQCFELCGDSHGRMLFRVIAESPEQYAAWVKSHQNPVTKPETALASTGEQTFMRRCASCHTVDGTNAKGRIGPNLTGFGHRTTIGGVLENTDQNLADWIADPAAIKPGSKMPNLRLKQDEINALVAYLKELK